MENKTDALPGFEHPLKIPELTEAALELKKFRQERMASGKAEKDAERNCRRIMQEHNNIVLYIDDDFDPPLKVELVSTEKVKIKMKDEDDGED